MTEREQRAVAIYAGRRQRRRFEVLSQVSARPMADLLQVTESRTTPSLTTSSPIASPLGGGMSRVHFRIPTMTLASGGGFTVLRTRCWLRCPRVRRVSKACMWPMTDCRVGASSLWRCSNRGVPVKRVGHHPLGWASWAMASVGNSERA